MSDLPLSPAPPLKRTLMIQGTTSDAGKSTLVAGLCRVLHRQGISVAPFKPQNMALNSAVTLDGGEIGRAQAVQAQAAGLEPHSDMNPVLLKPSSDTAAQVILQGRVVTDLDAAAFHDYKRVAMAAVLESYARLQAQYEVILVEGAGSPAEINLRKGDIANMGFAEAVDCPVLLIADIDRGGVFAHLTGTLALLSPSEQARVRGMVINRFRGDRALLEPGIDWLEQYTHKPVLGVLPYLHQLHIEAEDAIDVQQQLPDDNAIRVVVPVLPHISNHTDFDPLRLSADVDLQFIGPGRSPPPADLVILPGSKQVRGDLDWLRTQGWEPYLQRHLRYGGKLLGICGGFQMLGQQIDDPLGLEGTPGTTRGLQLLELHTELRAKKQLRRVQGHFHLEHAPLQGYEIHMGHSTGAALERPAVRLGEVTDGAVSADGQVIGTYVHGLLENHQVLNALLRWVGHTRPASPDYHALREASLNRLADTLEQELDQGQLHKLLLR